MGKLKQGQRARTRHPTPPRTDQPEPTGCATLRGDTVERATAPCCGHVPGSGRRQSRALQCAPCLLLLAGPEARAPGIQGAVGRARAQKGATAAVGVPP